MRLLSFKPMARDDLDELSLYLAKRSTKAATGFLHAVRQTTERLRARPGIGHRRKDLPPRYRVVRIRGFGNHLLVYRFDSRLLTVVRLLHGARDFGSVFLESEDTP